MIGHDGGDGLIKPKAFIVLRGSSTTVREGAEAQPSELANELKEFVKAHLAVYKYPRWIEFIDSMPKNDRGKIDRKELKERA